MTAASRLVQMARILIVDDEPVSRELLATLIRFKGHEALIASDGAEALALARSSRPQLVISDILMPTMDGYELLRQLRSDPELGSTEVIFHTASYHEKEAMHLAASGRAARVLIKPCEPAELQKAIDEALNGKAHPAGSPIPAEFDTAHLQLVTTKLWQRTSELEIANARLAALTDLHVQLASERDPRVLLEQVCHGARKLFGAKYAVLAARDKSADAKPFFAISG